MKRLTILLGAMVFAGCVNAETNAPLIMKGLYGTRSAGARGILAGRTYSPYEKGLRYLSAQQHPDGAWQSSNVVQTTAFGLVAFLDHGETTVSEKYGTNVIQSLKWVLSREPTNGWERVCLIHSLSAAYDLLKHPACLKRLRELLADLRPEALGKADSFIFQATRIPEDIRKNPKLSPTDLRAFTESSACPEVLKLYFESSVAFNQGGNTWGDWNRNVLATKMKAQEPDGSFAMEAASSPEEATVFTILAFSLYYHHNPWQTHWNVRWWPKENDPDEVEVDIENVDIEIEI
jgi:hypothetical protein